MSVNTKSREALLTGDLDEESLLYQKLLVDHSPDEFDETLRGPETQLVAPKPGWCVKTWTTDSKKIFLNVCTSELVLKPKDLSESEVQKIVDSEDPTKFRIPMGIGEPHKEHDLSGKDVDTYDIVIHPDFFEKCKQISYFKELFLVLVIEGLESKYDLNLCREYKILKNRKAMGTLQMQNVRKKSKPVIMEMDPVMYEMEKEYIEDHKLKPERPEITEISSTKTKRTTSYITPKYKMLQDPETGYPQFLVVEIDLPKQNTAEKVLLDVAEDRLLLHANDYMLDLDLPYDVNNNETGAQFDRRNKKLTVTMAVVPKK